MSTRISNFQKKKRSKLAAEMNYLSCKTLPVGRNHTINSSHLAGGQAPKRKGSSSNHPFSGANSVSFREGKFQEVLTNSIFLWP